MKLWAWLSDSWSPGQRAAERQEADKILRETVASGVDASSDRILRDVQARHRERRLRVRLFVIIVIVVAASAFATAFTSNRAARGIALAATASAAPVALYLGLRRD